MGLSDYDFERIMVCASEARVSDVHLHPNEPVFWRRHGNLSPLKEYVPEVCDLRRLFEKISDEEMRNRFNNGFDVDFAWSMEKWRYRVNAYRSMGNLSFALRTISRSIPQLEELGQAGKIAMLLEKRQGLILITGATSMGKSTTMASFINHLNRNNDFHIVTLEDPIEYTYPRGRSIVSQRELGIDFSSFTAALKSVLRQDPDVICVAEIRDSEVARMAIEAAATGHLVIATMHTANATEAVERLESMFEAKEQQQIRNMLASVLLGVFSQELIPSKQGGRVTAVEILLGNQSVRNLIRNGKYEQLMTVMQSSNKEGMQTMEMSKNELRRADVIED